MTTLQPRAGFDWSRVVWSGHAESQCSYCRADIPKEAAPLRLFQRQGELGAVFCEACMERWWSFVPDEENV